MRLFKINETTTASCRGYKTRNSWGHKAALLVNGIIVCKRQVNYYNRTWERYEYETILRLLLEKSKLFTDEEITKITESFY